MNTVFPLVYLRVLSALVVKKFSLAKTRRRKEKNSVQTQNIASLQFRVSVVKIKKKLCAYVV
jgi:hypothetical protein